MFTPRTLKNGKVNKQDYGLGFRIDDLTDSAYPGEKFRAIHHGGVAIGSQAMLIIMPKEGIVLAFCGNATTPERVFDTTSSIAIMFAAAAREMAQ
jgi:hypothetical protein